MTTTDLYETPATMSPAVLPANTALEYVETPVTELVSGHTFIQTRMGKVRHVSVTKIRRTDNYVVAEYMHRGVAGITYLREDTTVVRVAN